jgi:hypothetical protein
MLASSAVVSSIGFSSLAELDNVSPAPGATITPVIVKGLPKPSPRTASKNALAFNYAALFDGAAVQQSLNLEIIRAAESGRVARQFIELSSTIGLIVPASRAGFDDWSSAIITDIVAPMRSMVKSKAYCEALGLIRETLGMDTVTIGSWATPAPKAPAKKASIKAPSKTTTTTSTDDTSESLDAVVTSIVESLDVLTMAQLETLQAAVTAAMAKIAPM